MSEKSRTTQEIQSEYQQLAFKAGNLQYAIAEQTKDLGLLNTQLRELNFEFVASQAKEKAAAEAPKAEEGATQ